MDCGGHLAQGLKDAALVRSGYACNNACRFCDQGDWRDTRGDRPAAEVRAEVEAAARAAAAGGGVVVLSGGEVTLRPELVDWVRAAREGGARRVVIQTNGRMLAYKTLTRELVEAGADVFAVALHGHVAELHDWLTRAPGSFEQAIRGIRAARRHGARVLLNTVVTRPNYRHLADIARMLPPLDAAGVRFLWPRAEGVAADPRDVVHPPLELALPYLRHAADVARRLGRRVTLEGLRDAPTPEAAHVVA